MCNDTVPSICEVTAESIHRIRHEKLATHLECWQYSTGTVNMKIDRVSTSA